MQAYLDTNAVLRLAHGDLKKISKTAQKAIERYDLLISPMVWLELQYLFEIRRMVTPAESIVTRLDATIGLTSCPISFADIARAACQETWTRDVFDRIIVAHARFAGNAPLITADEVIPKHYKHTIW
ncbi:MAG: type II toxin-antitoxin system VapC family toxin [Bryobacteraceae bacterium]